MRLYDLIENNESAFKVLVKGIKNTETGIAVRLEFTLISFKPGRQKSVAIDRFPVKLSETTVKTA